MLFPSQAHDDTQLKYFGDIEQPAGRRGVDAHRIHARIPHRPKISSDRMFRGKLNSPFIGRERSVRHSSDPELLMPGKQKFTIYTNRQKPMSVVLAVLQPISNKTQRLIRLNEAHNVW